MKMRRVASSFSDIAMVVEEVRRLRTDLQSVKARAEDTITQLEHMHDDHPFIVLTETKFSFRCIPVWIGTLL